MVSVPLKRISLPSARPPVASTSKLPPTSTSSTNSELKPSLSAGTPDRKGKRKAEDDDEDASTASDDKVKVKAEDQDDDKLDPDEEILFHTVTKASIVGLKYAGGIRTLKQGMSLQLRRDPQNVSDSNAIEVRHAGGLRIGYMAKSLAGRLSPLVKERKIRLEGTAGEVPPNASGLPSVPMALEIWGKRRHALDPRLDWLFPDRREKKVEKSKQERALERVKKELEELDEEGGEGGSAKKGKKEGVKEEEGEGKAGTSMPGGGGKGGGGGSNGGLVKPPDLLMQQSILLEREQKRPDLLGDMFKAGEMDPANLPSHPSPPGKDDGSMRTNLLEFQRQGLAWMIKMEHPELPRSMEDKPVQLWQKKKDVENKTFWHNIATKTVQRDKPILKRGGILADEMGLGKTMQTIALICTDDTGEGVLDEPEEPDERFDDMTLIVCPLSVASNWTDQLQQHVGRKRLKWHFYHGEGRELSKKELRKFDVVIATYQTLAGSIEDDGKKKKSATSSAKTSATASAAEDAEGEDEHPFSKDSKYAVSSLEPAKKKARKTAEGGKDMTLHGIKWRRVVLDEGHLIKNPKAKMSRACMELKAERRWILTGTPIVNQVGDLGAMIQFLRMCKPLDDPQVWKQYVTRGGEDQSAKLLRAVVLSTTLRRTKDMVDASCQPLIRLPQVSFYQHKVQLRPAQRELYAEVEKEVAENVKESQKREEGKLSVTHLLCLLLRLRQLACDPALCPPDFIEDIKDRKLAARISEEHERAGGSSLASASNGGGGGGGGGGKADQLAYLRSMLRDAEDEDCMACSGLMVEPRITICQHVFCQSCIETAVDAGTGCPQCGWALKAGEIIEPSPSERSASPYSYRSSSRALSATPAFANAERTAKMEALVGLLKATHRGVKSLVFSQWTTHLDRIEKALEEEGIATCRFDGSMRQEKREEVIKLFTAPNRSAVAGSGEDKKNPMVMLLSLKAGALGLNLTVASQVFLMDPWWQPAIEQQAIDRVNRIGQTKDVRVFQIVAEDTVETRVLEIQAKKERLIAQAFSGSKNAVKGREKIESKFEDLAAIFGIHD